MSRLARIAAVFAVVVACGGTAPEATVVVSAASSLTGAFGAIETAFEAEHPGVDVVLNLGSSSTLAAQVLTGAPVDVFASADLRNMDRLAQADRVAESARFATNTPALAVAAGNPLGITGVTDLARGELVVGLCAVGVPCGDVAREALARAGVDPAVDTDEPNVRALVTKIASGEVDVGIVYATDVAASPGLAAIPMGLADDVVAEYWIAVIADASHPAGAQAFVDFVRSDQGRALLSEYGFGSP